MNLSTPVKDKESHLQEISRLLDESHASYCQYESYQGTIKGGHWAPFGVSRTYFSVTPPCPLSIWEILTVAHVGHQAVRLHLNIDLWHIKLLPQVFGRQTINPTLTPYFWRGDCCGVCEKAWFAGQRGISSVF